MNQQVAVIPFPQDLDRQSPVKIDRWLDIDSEECAAKDPDRATAKKWLKMGMDAGFLFLDLNGRVWGRGKDSSVLYPYHFNVGTTLYGYRIAKKASN